MKVLVADDYEVIRIIHISNLKKIGIRDIDQVSNGQDAMEAVCRHNYDLVILDWYMPVMDGLDVLKSIREKGNTTPVIMCTDEKDPDKMNLAMQFGAKDYIVKPYTPSEFSTKIQKFLRLS